MFLENVIFFMNWIYVIEPCLVIMNLCIRNYKYYKNYINIGRLYNNGKSSCNNHSFNCDIFFKGTSWRRQSEHCHQCSYWDMCRFGSSFLCLNYLMITSNVDNELKIRFQYYPDDVMCR